MSDLTPVILIGLICLAVGFALGALVGSLRSGKGEQHQESIPPFSPPKARPVSSQASPFPEQSGPVLAAAHPVQPAPEKPGLDPIKTIARAIQPSGAARNEAPASMAAQIDAILQEKLAQDPLRTRPPANQGVRLVEVPGRGVLVQVGLEEYDGVDQVPDPGIRELIRSAVDQWERAGGQA